jgi:hypothetical protein
VDDNAAADDLFFHDEPLFLHALIALAECWLFKPMFSRIADAARGSIEFLGLLDGRYGFGRVKRKL